MNKNRGSHARPRRQGTGGITRASCQRASGGITRRQCLSQNRSQLGGMGKAMRRQGGRAGHNTIYLESWNSPLVMDNYREVMKGMGYTVSKHKPPRGKII